MRTGFLSICFAFMLVAATATTDVGCTARQCGKTCSGDGCAAECGGLSIGVECGRDCTGEGCAARCAGPSCGMFCSGEGCAAECGGDPAVKPAWNGPGYSCGYKCSGEGCAARCNTMLCGSYCTGDGCAAECSFQSCGKACDTEGCAAKCSGKWCGESCKGKNCACGCTGVDCGRDCSGENCGPLATCPYTGACPAVANAVCNTCSDVNTCTTFTANDGFWMDGSTATACTAVDGAATVTCTSGSDSKAVTAADGFWLDGATPTACTAVDGAATVTCTSGSDSKAVTAADGFYMVGSTATACTAVDGAATVTCTSGSDSVAVTAADGFYMDSSNVLTVCVPVTGAATVTCTDGSDSKAVDIKGLGNGNGGGDSGGDGAITAQTAADNDPIDAKGHADGQTKTLKITMDLDGIDLSTLDAAGFAAIEQATEDMAAAQGIDMTTVSEIIYTQNGIVVKAPTATTRNRRASGDISMEFAFKAGAVVDVDDLVKKLATAIEKNEVTFSVEIDGKTIGARGFAAAAVDVPTNVEAEVGGPTSSSSTSSPAPQAAPTVVAPSGPSTLEIAMFIVSGVLFVVIIALLFVLHGKKGGNNRVTAMRV